jgi:gas vesicle protein
MTKRRSQIDLPPLNEGTVFKGLLIGALVGSLIRLWNLPRSGTVTRALMSNTGQELSSKLDPASAAKDSIAQGKAIARRNFEYDPDVK